MKNIFSLYRLAQEENTLKTYACDKNSTFVIERPSLLFFLHFFAVDAVINKKAKRFLRGNCIGYALYQRAILVNYTLRRNRNDKKAKQLRAEEKETLLISKRCKLAKKFKIKGTSLKQYSENLSRASKEKTKYINIFAVEHTCSSPLFKSFQRLCRINCFFINIPISQPLSNDNLTWAISAIANWWLNYYLTGYPELIIWTFMKVKW